MSEPLYDYDPAEALDSAEAIEVFMADALETGATAYVVKAEAVANQARQSLRDRSTADEAIKSAAPCSLSADPESKEPYSAL